MAKGNYTALQQLKPAEIKVGEFYNNWVDGYIKRGEAERAKEAKLLADQKKEIGEKNMAAHNRAVLHNAGGTSVQSTADPFCTAVQAMYRFIFRTEIITSTNK